MERYDITIQMLGVEASGPQYVWEKVPAEEGELVLYTDAQATIAALQARVQELEEWKHIVTGAGTDQESVIRLAAYEYTKIAVQCWKEANAKLESQLAQRTAELEAAKAIQAIDMKNNNAYREQVANLQAELERVRGELSDMRAKHPEDSCYGAMPKLRKEVAELRTLIAANKETKHDAI